MFGGCIRTPESALRASDAETVKALDECALHLGAWQSERALAVIGGRQTVLAGIQAACSSVGENVVADSIRHARRTVVDHDRNPNRILDSNLENEVQVEWSFTGKAVDWLPPVMTFRVDVYAESIGPGPERRIGQVMVPGTGPLIATAPIPAHLLPPTGPGEAGPSGVYRLTTVITCTAGCGANQRHTPIAGFVDGLTIEMR
jgi:hypothetical protein